MAGSYGKDGKSLYNKDKEDNPLMKRTFGSDFYQKRKEREAAEKQKEKDNEKRASANAKADSKMTVRRPTGRDEMIKRNIERSKERANKKPEVASKPKEDSKTDKYGKAAQNHKNTSNFATGGFEANTKINGSNLDANKASNGTRNYKPNGLKNKKVNNASEGARNAADRYFAERKRREEGQSRVM